MFETIFIQPLANLLVIFTNIFGSLGWGIIVITLLIKILLIPVMIPSLKSGEKMKQLAPKLEKLKKKHEGDKEKLAQAQMALYRSEGVNPAAGCLPSIIQLVILLALFQVFNRVLNPESIDQLAKMLYSGISLPPGGINFSFWYLDLTSPDVIAGRLPGVFLALSAVAQILTARLSSPTIKGAKVSAQKTPSKGDDMMVSMQKQMTFLMPLMTIIIGFRFPSGLTLYWFVFSLAGLVQQYIIKRNTDLTASKRQVKHG
ncbi:MAG: YidC/Oxa1 family membrane protein insertase [Candidatus Shapirobacteria bacterium]|nr:YidC/Oxa1 family membrane protein insertase [Candidatus Shapirobacteria bacterium]MDD5073611.1 YidC/Oxa1 family membrane protein insertase [Candidatus Shapirobacteria bacterium]MDD5481364.1 YidC/Oxa1 family membrane protein insertase [Candidatus Shapirobacteria bacterium]